MPTVVSVQRLPGGKKRAQFRLVAEVQLGASPQRIFSLLSDPRELNGLTPPWFHLDFLNPPPDQIAEGTRLGYRLSTRGLRWGWESRIDAWDPPRQFSYTQTRGPYRWFWHDHQFHPIEGGTLVRDVLEYSVWGGPAANRLLVERWLRQIFDWRGRVLACRFGSV